MRRFLLRCLVVGSLAGFLLLNALAFVHARSFTRFTDGPRTRAPARLSFGEKLSVLMRGARLPHARNTVTPDQRCMPFERHVFEGRNRLALEAWFIPHAAPRGVVVGLHGYGGCKDTLLPQARAFRELGFAVLLVDFPGSGGSDGASTSIGFHEAEDVAHTVAHARALPGGERIVVYGESMGAAAALKAAGDGTIAPEAIIAEAPFDRFRTTVAHRFEEMGLPAFPLADLLLFWGGVQQGFPAFSHDPRVYASHVREPLLLIHGDHDPYVTPDESRSIASAARGPVAELTCPGVRHASCLDARPLLWREAVTRFLAQHVPVRAEADRL